MKLEHNSQHGYFFRVSLKEEPVLRQNSQFQIIDAVKGGCRFTTNRLSDLNDRHKEIITEYEQAQTGCVTEVLEVAGRLIFFLVVKYFTFELQTQILSGVITFCDLWKKVRIWNRNSVL